MTAAVALSEWHVWLGAGLPAAAALWFSVRWAWWRRALPRHRPRVLMYHMVTPHPPGTRCRGLRVPPEMFERQLAWLCRRNFRFVTMRQLAEGTAPENSVVLTFDDGYADNYHTVTPLLQKYGARATLYPVALRDDGTDWAARKKPHHNSGELVREPKLTGDQIRDMLATGCWELGAHTLTHPLLTALTDAERQTEIAGSRQRLQEQFGVPVESFAYTFGIFGPADRAAVEQAGFTTAVTTEPGAPSMPLADCLTIPRIKISGKEGLFSFRLRVRTGRRGLWK